MVFSTVMGYGMNLLLSLFKLYTNFTITEKKFITVAKIICVFLIVEEIVVSDHNL